MTSNNTTLIVLLTTAWSGIVSFAVAKWTLNKQNHLNDIGAVVKLIERTNSSAQAYWLSSGRKHIVEAKLKNMTYKLGSEIGRVFPNQKGLLSKLEAKNKDFRKEITGGPFETKGRLEEHGRASLIQETSQEMITLIYDSKKDGWFN